MSGNERDPARGEQISVLNPATDTGAFEAVTESGTAYVMIRLSHSGPWHVRRFPGPGAPPLWLDAGGVVSRLECAVGQPARFEVSGGYMDEDLWARSSAVLAIVRLPDDLPATEAAWVDARGGVPLDDNFDAADVYQAEVDAARRAYAEANPVTVAELAAILHADGSTFAWRSAEQLSLIMSTPQDDLVDAQGEPLTPWAWLAVGGSTGPVLGMLANEDEA
ncbi:hypothetical protein E3T54_13090 [Cryobacterium sp. Sr8]|uniref:hypothetical protein n=1 Tax=Cryobacterium sp. Sr8 TaxID=1259203 RepID=UPI001068F399|nr:hypothetical protein [Cryobacterium sp. Sr8]TFD74879.1 hypothetical protein E3T54_13090 [Cryobacterium sp. Sr8]